MSFSKKNIFIFLLFVFSFVAFAQTTVQSRGVQNNNIQNTLTQNSNEEINTKSGPKILSFKYKKNDSFRTLSKVHEDVYVNRVKHNHAEILNRISAKITDVTKDGSGVYDVTFMTSEALVTEHTKHQFNYGKEYKSIFTRNSRGIYTIENQYFMPVVRDVPVFPETPVKPGDTWTFQGHEAHDLRREFEIQEPFKVPFLAKYTYKGTVLKDNRTLDVIEVQYTLSFESPKSRVSNPPTQAELMRPISTWGFSRQNLYWDNERGELDHYNEEFNIQITTYSGYTYTFVGTAEAEVEEFIRTNDDDTMKKIQDKVDELGLENMTVKKGEKGLTISLDKIQFQPDSAILMQSEKDKLDKIADILKGYNNDLLITGHTALRGREKDRQQLSEERAQSVADYLIMLGVRDTYHIFTQGKGAREPIATNQTEAGRILNRRVEITIMDE
ncbi:MAG: OmpA family protein [Treponema sp.]|nr:OmpA family protein [Treponema sp.]